MLVRSATKHNNDQHRYNDCYPHNSHSHLFKIPKLSAYTHSRLKLQNCTYRPIWQEVHAIW